MENPINKITHFSFKSMIGYCGFQLLFFLHFMFKGNVSLRITCKTRFLSNLLTSKSFHVVVATRLLSIFFTKCFSSLHLYTTFSAQYLFAKTCHSHAKLYNFYKSIKLNHIRYGSKPFLQSPRSSRTR